MLPTVDFAKNAETKDGLYTYCNSCKYDIERLKKYPARDLPEDAAQGNLERPAPKKAAAPVHAKIPVGILNGIKVPDKVEQTAPGMWKWTSPKGWRVLAIHYSADPTKDPKTPAGAVWVNKRKASMSERDWKREMEIDHTVSEGEPFFPTFNRMVHVRPCEYDPERPLVRAWDFGKAHPAVVFGQLDKRNQLRILFSMIETNKDIFSFAPFVLGETNQRYPGAKLVDYCDPAGSQETDKGSTTMILSQKFGITLHYRFSFLEEGLRMMEQRLKIQEYGEPGMIVDPINHDLINGLAGGYKLDVGASGKDSEGRLKNNPKKDGWFDHLMDALRYMYIGLFTLTADDKVSEAEAWEKVGLWRTNKQHRDKNEDMEALGEFCG